VAGNSGASYLAACMIYKNQASYLQEWLEFHVLVGVERFFLYDNDSTDEHHEVLKPYLDERIATLTAWPGRSRPGYDHQAAAYNHCLDAHRSDARWIAFIDDDEFLFSADGEPVPRVLNEYEPYPGIGVNQALFATCGHETRPEGLVIENYVFRTASSNPTVTWIKSIVDPREVLFSRGGHACAYRSGFAVDVHGRPIDGVNTADEWHTQSISTERLRINHYFTKSAEEYKAKLGRPTLDTAAVREFEGSDWLRRMEARHQRDEAILMYLPELKGALRRRARSGPGYGDSPGYTVGHHEMKAP
jgi:glycosyl transferase family 92